MQLHLAPESLQANSYYDKKLARVRVRGRVLTLFYKVKMLRVDAQESVKTDSIRTDSIWRYL